MQGALSLKCDLKRRGSAGYVLFAFDAAGAGV